MNLKEVRSSMDSDTTSHDLRVQRLILSRRDKCLSEYNQHMKPEDADVTSSIYIQILAIEFIMGILSILSIFMALILEFAVLRTTINKVKYLILILTIIHIISVFMETRCRLSWMMEKKALYSAWGEYTFAVFECLFLVPIPNFWMVGHVYFFNYSTLDYEPITLDSLLTVYLLLRIFYVVKFLIHVESYYGSRPDRLARYYAVNISNFNAMRFLINQKPFRSLLTMYFISMLLLPLSIYLLEGPINPVFESYFSCMYFFIISQSTVGYGDMYPVTVLGRIISIGMIIMGLFFTSLVLIFIVAELKLTSNEEDTHYLLGRLQTQTNMKRIIVKRIKECYYVKKGLFEPQQKKRRLQELAITKLENRRMIYISLTSEPANMKRMFMKNFSQLHHLIKQFADKHEFLNEFCSVLTQKAPGKKRFNLKKQTNVTNLYNLIMQKESEESSQDDL